MSQEEIIDRFSYFIKNNLEKCFLYISIIQSIIEQQKPIDSEDGRSIYFNTTKNVYWECLLSKISLFSDFTSEESKIFFNTINNGDNEKIKIAKSTIVPTVPEIKETYDKIEQVRNNRLSHINFFATIDTININNLII